MSYEVLAEHIEPGREERRLPAPKWALDSPAGQVIRDLAPDGMLYRHQSLALDRVNSGSNLVISTGTASGKTLVFQLSTLDTLAKEPRATAIAIYPIKALSRDQLSRWHKAAPQAGLHLESVKKIDGDTPIKERQGMLAQTRIAAMTPDIIHRWLLNYSDERFTRSPEVNQSKQVCREFIRNLAVVIIDEAHVYETSFGANMAYLMRRLRAKRQELNPKNPEPLFIAASATIRNPTEHLEQLTGLRFAEITEGDNGSPKAPLTVQHILGRTQGTGSEQDMTEIIRDLMREHRDGSYIAFADDRQRVERIAANIEPTGLIHEDDIINDSQMSMPYRAGLQARESIERKLKDGSIRGVVSTSALEMGIDIPELTVGINLGLPNTVKRTKQRAGRVGRRSPGRFIIVEDFHAFQFDQDGLKGYWERDPEPANLYLTNRRLQRIQAACLIEEQGRSANPTDMNWPPGFDDAVKEGKEGDPYFPETGESPAGAGKRPHQHDMRSIDEKQFAVYVEGEEKNLTEMSKVEAMKELYTWATYHHAKQSYSVVHWKEDGDENHPEPHVVIRLTGRKNRRTMRVMETEARINLQGATTRENESGMIGYAGSDLATGTEKISGVKHLEKDEDSRESWKPYRYEDFQTPDIRRKVSTDMTFLAINEEWFESAETRERTVNALKAIMCHLDNVAPEEIMTAHTGITVERDGTEASPPAIALWDRANGGLGLSKTLYDRIEEYANQLLAIAEDPGRAESREMPLPLNHARSLRTWVEGLPDRERRNRPSIRPVETIYKGVTFRSKLEARWAYHLDQDGIKWEYEPTSFVNWVPDFRLQVRGEVIYAEVKPMEGFPTETAEKIDRSAWDGPAMILGATPSAVWKRENGRWETR